MGGEALFGKGGDPQCVDWSEQRGLSAGVEKNKGAKRSLPIWLVTTKGGVPGGGKKRKVFWGEGSNKPQREVKKRRKKRSSVTNKQRKRGSQGGSSIRHKKE